MLLSLACEYRQEKRQPFGLIDSLNLTVPSPTGLRADTDTPNISISESSIASQVALNETYDDIESVHAELSGVQVQNQTEARIPNERFRHFTALRYQ